ncbi:MAG: hypothetical protein KQJ78_20285 [Deltaproteobacteria bacterium]|nr:hypothetical protein [Deltaproteobacteria bacterium]
MRRNYAKNLALAFTLLGLVTMLLLIPLLDYFPPNYFAGGGYALPYVLMDLALALFFFTVAVFFYRRRGRG